MKLRIIPAALLLTMLSGASHLAEVGTAQAQNEHADPKAGASDASASQAEAKPSEAKPAEAKAPAPTEQHPGLVATIKDASGATPQKDAPAAAPANPVAAGNLPKSLDTCTFAEGADLLKQKEDALKERERKIAEREALLVVTEVRVNHEIKRMAALKEQLARYVDKAETAPREDAKRLAALYGSMKAAKAAERMDLMQPDMIVEILDLIDETRATGILAALEPNKAKEVTALILERHKPPVVRKR